MLVGLVIVGLLLMFGLTLRALLQPVSTGGKALVSATGATVAAGVNAARSRVPADQSGQGPSAAAAAPAPSAPRAKARPSDQAGPPGTEISPVMPAPTPSPAPLSQTVWAGGAPDVGARPPVRAPVASPAAVDGLATAAMHPPTADTASAGLGFDSDATLMPRRPRTWSLPKVDLLDRGAMPANGAKVDHIANTRIIEEKLRSFQIPAQVVGVNSGPVVTQYEVKPDVRVKLSRIEGLADDLAMALAARSIRIEAPIPGKDVVGIEIPNHASEVVGFRRLYEDARMEHATSKLTFALGRDVSGKAYAVDLGTDAPPAHRRRHRVGQERLCQRAHHQPPHARHAPGGGARSSSTSSVSSSPRTPICRISRRP